jgi:predicted FMN-binding regulatory protein PaiB
MSKCKNCLHKHLAEANNLVYKSCNKANRLITTGDLPFFTPKWCEIKKERSIWKRFLFSAKTVKR